MRMQRLRIEARKIILAGVLLAALAIVAAHARSYAAAGACSAPATDYGTVTSSVNITGSGTYRVWTRLAAPDSTNNTVKLEIDGAQCFTIGGSTVPVFTSTQNTNGNRFTATSTNWFAKDSTSAFIDVNLTAGNHTFKLIGNAPGVVVDRIVLTQDTSCTPTGTGDNCAYPPDTTKPTVSMTAPASGATNVSTTPTLTATAADDVAVQKVDFYVDGTKVGTDTTTSYSFTITTALSAGTHTAYAIATDTSANTQQSTTVSFTVGSGATYQATDINQDGHCNYLDLSALAGNYGKTGAGITTPRADINGDGTVNYLDLSALASKYGTY